MNPGKGVAPSLTPRCSSYWKGSLLVTLDYGCQQLSRFKWSNQGKVLYCHLQHHNDTIINRRTQEDFFNKIFTSHFIARVRKGLLKVCVWEGAGDRTELNCFDLHCDGRQRCVFLVLLMLNRRPWGPLC